MIIQLNAQEQAAQCLGLTLAQLRRAAILHEEEVDEPKKLVVARYIEALTAVRKCLEPLFGVLVDRSTGGIEQAFVNFMPAMDDLDSTFHLIDIRPTTSNDVLLSKHVQLTEEMAKLPSLLTRAAERFMLARQDTLQQMSRLRRTDHP